MKNILDKSYHIQPHRKYKCEYIDVSKFRYKNIINKINNTIDLKKYHDDVCDIIKLLDINKHYFMTNFRKIIVFFAEKPILVIRIKNVQYSNCYDKDMLIELLKYRKLKKNNRSFFSKLLDYLNTKTVVLSTLLLLSLGSISYFFTKMNE